MLEKERVCLAQCLPQKVNSFMKTFTSTRQNEGFAKHLYFYFEVS